ncbi:hypothetical protein BRETT_001339 [Brettanomyces bruxellensis]|uniref:Matrin-type domain-containing protein n=1 Tax=Dekkera bruxellensis TaxID=5007 RepID=A0A871RAB4_DEKBR|nr:uncharacterized protein BRETT_001339 [Brettanomyces bruxellensis]QOU21614.1 hypothetical protein BRETT_001339 [Brettanomyces bruxellensis]
MGRYYCPYCDVFLEHDSHSVIRSHLQGKNHVRLYCQYYQTICLKDPTQDPSYRPGTLSPPYQYSLSRFYAGMPGHLHKHEDSISESLELPPPPTLAKFPPPPPSHYFFDTEKRHQLTEKAAEDEYRQQRAFLRLRSTNITIVASSSRKTRKIRTGEATLEGVVALAGSRGVGLLMSVLSGVTRWMVIDNPPNITRNARLRTESGA